MVKEHTAECELDNMSVNDILDQICKDIYMYPYVKQQKSMRDRKGAFNAVHKWWLGLNHMNVVKSKAELALQI